MENPLIRAGIEAKPETLEITVPINRPIGVDILRLSDPKSRLPRELALNTKLNNEVEFRQKIADELIGVPNNGPVYDDLTKFILEDQNNTRIILYLPFEILPDLKENASVSAQKFAKVLHDGWIRLLFESEVRASFNDGDELEPGLGEPERTRKAAHLLPEFLKRGIVTTDEVIKILTISDEDQLIQALTEGAVVARDRNLFDDQSWDKIYQLSRNKNGIAFVLEGINVIKTNEYKPINVDEALNLLDSELISIDKKFASDSVHSKSVSEKRVKWEKWVEKNKAFDKTATSISANLIDGNIQINDVLKIINRPLSILTLQKIGESLDKTNKDPLDETIQISKNYITDVWASGTKQEKDAVVTCVNHWEKLGIVPNHFAENLGIFVPDLSNPFPIDLNNFASNEGQIIFDITKKIEANPALSEFIYPFILTFGSKVKGYSDENGDLDMAIFIKPKTTWEKREELLSLLRTSVPEIKNIDRLLEFWVNEKEGDLGLRPIPQNAPNIVVGPAQIHFLFGGIWIGQGEDLQKLTGNLTKKYLDLNRFGDQKDAVRTKLLRQLELDVLQYRLMHKGYRKFYPPEKELGTQNSDLIDWKSDFWDQGYRKIATQLFLKRVFLPDLSPTD